MSRESEHICHAKGCDVLVPPARFMCMRHWRMLPEDTRDLIWSVYRDGQEITMTPSAEYLQIAREAIAWLAAKEGI